MVMLAPKEPRSIKQRLGPKHALLFSRQEAKYQLFLLQRSSVALFSWEVSVPLLPYNSSLEELQSLAHLQIIARSLFPSISQTARAPIVSALLCERSQCS